MTMKRKRLLRLIEAFGADPSRWPADEREAAERLLAESPDIETARREAAALDRCLAHDVAVARPGAEDRIRASLARLPAQAHRRRAWGGWIATHAVGRELQFAWPQFATFAAAAVLGLVIGGSDLFILMAPASSGDIAALAFDVSPGIGVEP